jgi:hypothetical protein
MLEKAPNDYLSDLRAVIENDEASLKGRTDLLDEATGLGLHRGSDSLSALQLSRTVYSSYLIKRGEKTIGYISFIQVFPSLVYEVISTE